MAQVISFETRQVIQEHSDAGDAEKHSYMFDQVDLKLGEIDLANKHHCKIIETIFNYLVRRGI